MQLKEAKRIIEQIIQKGGLMGSCASLIKDNNQAVIQFLIECGELTDYQHMLKHWGSSLTKQIKKVALDYKLHQTKAGTRLLF